MKRLGLFLVLGACAADDAALVRLDAAEVFSEARLTAADLDRLAVEVTAADLPDAIAGVASPDAPVVELLIPAGADRRIEATGWTPAGALAFWGTTRLDLEPGAVVTVEMPVFGAGVVTGTLSMLDGAALPPEVSLHFVALAPRPDQPATLEVAVVDGRFSQPTPSGDYDVQISGTTLRPTTASFSLDQGQALDLALLLAPVGACPPGAVLDADGDGVACDVDCDDGRATCSTDCTDADGDGACVGHDCDDDDDLCATSCLVAYTDADGDSAGDAGTAREVCTLPLDGVLNGDDCDDGRPHCSASCVDGDADGFCVGHDCDDGASGCTSDCGDSDGDGHACDGDCDDSAVTGGSCFDTCVVVYRDADEDGFGDALSSVSACSAPAGHVVDATDCDDTKAGCAADCDLNADGDAHCGAADCDDSPATGASCFDTCATFHRDFDSDGFGDLATTTVACGASAAYIADDTDCDDTKVGCSDDCAFNADGDAFCGSSDCDDNAATGGACFDACVTFHLDDDGDGFGDADFAVSACAAPEAYVADGTDCDDSKAGCTDDCADNADGDDHCGAGDCDGSAATGGACFDGCLLFYRDADADGFGDGSNPTSTCGLPTGYVADDTDCDDTKTGCTDDCAQNADDDAYCGASDCDDSAATGASCFDSCTTFYVDSDGDGFGSSAFTVEACAPPDGYQDDSSDCDDDLPLCDLDCSDGDGDEACTPHDCDETAVTGPLCAGGCLGYRPDGDRDGAGSPGPPLVRCVAPPANVANATDCDDTDPNNQTSCGACVDTDGDGAFAGCDQYVTIEPDCDDTNKQRNPHQIEKCNDGVDNDCDDLTDTGPECACPDGDGDGYRCSDCNDGSVAVKPVDPDGDGWTMCSTPADCDEAQWAKNPGQYEICGNGVDNDCDYFVDDDPLECAGGCNEVADGDADGATICQEPLGDDTPWAGPGRAEHCNDGVDNDLDGSADASDTLGCSGADADRDGYPAGVDCADGVAAMNLDDADNDGHTTCAGDCDDADASVYPTDVDGDGVNACSSDCEPANPFVAGGGEVCNGWDDDCDGQVDEACTDGEVDGVADAVDNCVGVANETQIDLDFDGSGAACDCDDGDPLRGGNHPETCNDVIDNDCDGEADGLDADCSSCPPASDGDGDGFCAGPVLDCDDTDAAASPGNLVERGDDCDDGIDNDCDFLVDQADEDCRGSVCQAGLFGGALARVEFATDASARVEARGELRDACSYGANVGVVGGCTGVGEDLWFRVRITDDDATADMLRLCNLSEFNADLLFYSAANCGGTLSCAVSSLPPLGCTDRGVTGTRAIDFAWRATVSQCGNEEPFRWSVEYFDSQRF